MNLPPLICESQEQFTRICKPLSELNESVLSTALTIQKKPDKSAYYPACQRLDESKPALYSDDSINKFILEFIKANKKWGLDFDSLFLNIYKVRVAPLNNEALMNKYVKVINEIGGVGIDRYVETIASLKNNISKLEEEKEQLKDLVIFCASDKFICTHSQLFRNSQFFLKIDCQEYENFRNDYPNVHRMVKLTDFEYETVIIYINFLEDKNVINSIKYTSEIIDLYKLGDVLKCMSLKQACFARLQDLNSKEKFSYFKIQSILVTSQLKASDPLIQWACQLMANQYKKSDFTKQGFSIIPRDYLIEILKQPKLQKVNQKSLLIYLVRWAKEAKRGSEKTSHSAILLDKINEVALISFINFKSFTDEDVREVIKMKEMKIICKKKLWSRIIKLVDSTVLKESFLKDFKCETKGDISEILWRVDDVRHVRPGYCYSPNFTIRRNAFYLTFKTSEFVANAIKKGYFLEIKYEENTQNEIYKNIRLGFDFKFKIFCQTKLIKEGSYSPTKQKIHEPIERIHFASIALDNEKKINISCLIEPIKKNSTRNLSDRLRN